MFALRSAVLIPALCLAALPAQELTDSERAAVAELCQPWDRDDGPGISVAIARGGEIVYRDGFGLAQLEYDQPIDPDTVFHVASVSKQFTAFALVLLERDGVLSIDDDVRKHVPWLHDFGSTITIRHLLNHTSGIRDQWELLAMSGCRLDDVLTQDHILRILRNQRELNFEPGNEYLYSNMGFSLAAEVVAVASGQPFPEFCKERIFEPLQMNATHFHLDHRQIVPMRAYSYAPKGSGWQKGVLSYANVGATSLFTTAPDLTRWLVNLGTGEVGGKQAIEALCTKGKLNDGEELSYALGIIVNDYKGQRAWRHSGGDAGFRSEALYFPDAELAIAVLANGGNIRPQRIANGIADALLGDRLASGEPVRPREEPAAPRETIPIDDATLNRIAGRYTAESLPEIVISRDGANARVEIVGQGRGQLFRSAPNAYFVREAAITFEFVFGDGDSGPSTGLILEQRGRQRRFRRAAGAEREVDTRAWAGRYYCPELEVFYAIVVEGDRVFARHRRHGEIPLKRGSGDEAAGQMFFFRKVVFEREGDEVTGFRLSGSRVRNLKFVRVE